MRTEKITYDMVFTYRFEHSGESLLARYVLEGKDDWNKNLSEEGVRYTFHSVTRDWDKDVTLVAAELVRREVIVTEKLIKKWNIT